MLKLGLVAAVVIFTTPAYAAKVTLFGANWCGPCKAVRAYLQEQRVQFEYLNVDDEANDAAFTKVAKGSRSIPVTVIERDVIRGSNLTKISEALVKNRVLSTPAATRAAGQDEEVYGGHAATWWLDQFRDLRNRHKELKSRVQDLDRVAVDSQERGEVLPRMKNELKILEASINQLELDASHAAVPRQYRAY